jgi:hypothetical protein
LLREEVAFPYGSPFHGSGRDPATMGSHQIQEFVEAKIVAKQRFISPGRLSNQGALIYDSYDYTRYQRKRWLYAPALKRVIRLPRAQLDQPVRQKDGIVGLDDTDMYRGSPELFDWELAGRQEMLIPYNAYALEDTSLSFKDLIHKHHLNQQHTRYERHRVWKVIATAKKESSRYRKRIFYLDEDTWQIVLSEKYDQTGGLVMHAEAHTVNFYDVPVVFTGVIAHYQLDDGRFVVTDINNMLLPYDWIDEINPRNFGPIALENYVR